MTEKAPNYMINFWEQQERDALKQLMVARTALARLRYEDKDGNSMVDSSGGII